MFVRTAPSWRLPGWGLSAGRASRVVWRAVVEREDGIDMAHAAQIRANAVARRLFGWDFVVTILPAAILLAIVGMSRPAALHFANNTAEQVGRTLLSLFLVALLFERALEVIIGSWRGPGAAELESELNALDDALEFLPKDTGLSPGDRADREKTLVEARSDAVARTVAYRCATKRLALHAAFLLGLAVAVAGLRTVEPSIVFPSDVPALQATALKMLDALLTGGVIAGGSEGIHKIMQVFTDFAQATSRRAKET
jgi:hypothetical protein